MNQRNRTNNIVIPEKIGHGFHALFFCAKNFQKYINGY